MNKLNENLKIVFMGTPDFAKASLQALVEAGMNVIACVTNPDSKAGRGMKLRMSPVKEYALSQEIPVFQPEKIRGNNEIIEQIKSLEPDVIAVVAYGKILPKEILEIPRLGAINVHGSLLPDYRGSAPMQWAIINGEEKTGITTMYMDEGMDTGDMLLTEEMAITEQDNFETIHDKMKDIGAKLLVTTIQQIGEGTIARIPQPEECRKEAPMITKEMTKIDFNKTAKEISCFVRGLTPIPGTYIELDNGVKYKIYRIEAVEDLSIDASIENGSILLLAKDKLYIRCEDGYIKILEIQPAGSKRMNITAFFAGNRISMANKCV